MSSALALKTENFFLLFVSPVEVIFAGISTFLPRLCDLRLIPPLPAVTVTVAGYMFDNLLVEFAALVR